MRVAYRPGFIYHRIYRGFIVFFFLTSERLNYKLRRLKTRIILFKNRIILFTMRNEDSSQLAIDYHVSFSTSFLFFPRLR